MANVFISYRRNDSIATAGRIRDRLVQDLGERQVFVDVDSIREGEDFQSVIAATINRSDVVLAVIGPRWLEVQDEFGRRRIDDPDDLVAAEVGMALERKGTTVIPVLVDNARMPHAGQLPVRLKALVRRNAIELRNERFGTDAERLLRAIYNATGTRRISPSARGALMALAVAAAVGVTLLGWSFLKRPAAPANTPGRPGRQQTVQQSAVASEAVAPKPPIASDRANERTPSLPQASPVTNKDPRSLDPVATLRSILSPAEGRMQVGIRGGGVVKLGNQIVFMVSTKVAGRLILIDVNAAGEVVQLFPNSFVKNDLVTRVPADAVVTVPGPGYGFTGFQAVEPAGRGRLIALVHPDLVQPERFAMVQAQIPKGFAPVNAPGEYMAQLIEQIARASHSSGADQDKAAGWAFAVSDYEIVR